MQKLNFQSKDYGRILFSSDFHIDHKRDFVFKPRGFRSWEEHTDFIVKNLLSLKKDDLLIYLGDFALNTTDERVQAILNSVQCETYMCYGNHNSGIRRSYNRAKISYLTERFSDDVEIYPLKIAENVTMMGDAFNLCIDGKSFYCNHFATMIWDGQQHGYGALFGHSHGGLKGAQPEDVDCGKILDCGVDNALKYNSTPFFFFPEIVEIMNRKNIKTYDHHGK